MPAEWLDEVLRQLRLASLWYGYAGLLEKAGAVEASSTLRRMNDLWLTESWLPGLAEAVEELCAGTPCEAFVGDEGPRAVENWLRGTLLSATEANDRLRAWLLDGVRQVRAKADVRLFSAVGTASSKEDVWRGPAVEVRLRCWIAQALALRTWLQEKDERQGLRENLARRGQWISLRDDCQRLIDTVPHSWSLFHRARSDETGEVIRRCRSAFDELLKDAPMESAEGLLDRLEKRTTELLETMPPDWPPLCLAHVPASLARPQQLAAILDQPLPWVSAPVPLSGLALDGQARLMLARLVVVMVPACTRVETEWPIFVETIRNLVGRSAECVELVHTLSPTVQAERIELRFKRIENPESSNSLPANEAACLTLLPASQETDVALDAADKLRARTANLSIGRDLLEGPVARLFNQTRTRLLTGAFAVAAETLLGETLGALSQVTQELAEPQESLARPTADLSAVWDELLIELRRWGRTFNLDILPRSWSFAQPPMRDQLAEDERSGVNLFFRPLDTKGLVYRVRTFGLAHGDARIFQPCQVLVSVGPSPAGFSELEALVREPVHPVETLLQQRLRCWREAVLNDVLDVVAVQLYVEFWGPAGAPLRQQEPERANRFAERLATLLDQALGLRTFNPVRYQDYRPDWLELATDRGVVSGRVRRVLRPGLQDDRQRLRVPAMVEVE